jgi:ribosomal protein S18 acetylase RimI-like enzyme
MSYKIRNATPDDYKLIIVQVDDWWGGRSVAPMLNRLFFTHFQPTTFVLEKDGIIAAFLAGFISQTDPTVAYIHFIGVHPEHRRKGLAEKLYRQFFEVVKAQGCREVQSVTSPGNQTSIVFHTALGFKILPGNATEGGVDHAVTKSCAKEKGRGELKR